MAGFTWAGDLNGQKNPLIREVYIPTATAIEKGEPVIYTVAVGAAVVAGTDFDDPIAGVATAAHAANSGTKLEISYSPTAIYKYRASKTYTMTGGSTTTVVDSSLVPATDDFFIGGMVEIVNCVADTSLNGNKYKISDSTGGSGTLTLSETLPVALASGDTYRLCLGYMAEGYLGYDLDSDGMNPDFDAIGGTVLKFLYSNPETMEMFFTFERYGITS
jgi:hypothetical protein